MISAGIRGADSRGGGKKREISGKRLTGRDAAKAILNVNFNRANPQTAARQSPRDSAVVGRRAVRISHFPWKTGSARARFGIRVYVIQR
jgi:hypothetical protein